jgi:hypothetical protein
VLKIHSFGNRQAGTEAIEFPAGDLEALQQTPIRLLARRDELIVVDDSVGQTRLEAVSHPGVG